jgi:hypothetical protein
MEEPKTETSSPWNVPSMMEARSNTKLAGELIFLKCARDATQFF